MRITKNMRRWLRMLPLKIPEIPAQERIKLERAGLAELMSCYGFPTYLELTPAGRKWLEENPEKP